MKVLKFHILLVVLVGCSNKNVALDARYAHTPGAQYKHASFSDNSIEIKTISAQSLLSKIQKNENILVVNVLGSRFHEDAHIKGSINAPLRFLENTAASWDKKQQIIVYCACQECDASQKACKLLHAMGFNDVLAYEGGMREWFQLGYPCNGPCKEAYLREPLAKKTNNGVSV